VTAVIKDRTLQFRVNSDQDTLLRAAAAATNSSLTQFVMEPALARAVELVSQPQEISLPKEQFDAMLAALDQPAQPIEVLVKLARRPRRFVRA